MDPGGTYRKETIRLAELAQCSNVIRNVTFEHCVISGPAVVALQDCALTDCTFQGSDEELFWDVGGRRAVLGAIALVECTITNSRFEQIGLLCTSENVGYLKTKIGFR